jgi:hypothetical protein
MDLGTVRRRLESKHYQKVSDWVADVETIWSNAMSYNSNGSLLYLIALELQQWFRKRIAKTPWGQEEAKFIEMARSAKEMARLAEFPPEKLLDS